MNSEMIHKVADWIEAHHDQFDLRFWLKAGGETDISSFRQAPNWIKGPGQLDCGTTCCIAGAALIMEGLTDESYWQRPSDTGANLLGLTEDEAYNLFYGDSDWWADVVEEYEIHWNEDLGEAAPTGEEAALILRDIADEKLSLRVCQF